MLGKSCTTMRARQSGLCCLKRSRSLPLLPPTSTKRTSFSNFWTCPYSSRERKKHLRHCDERTSYRQCVRSSLLRSKSIGISSLKVVKFSGWIYNHSDIDIDVRKAYLNKVGDEMFGLVHKMLDIEAGIVGTYDGTAPPLMDSRDQSTPGPSFSNK